MIKDHYENEIKYPGRFLQKGELGIDVERLQEFLLLAALQDPVNLLALGTDGDYGPQTRRVVIAYQKRENIKPDGVVGPVTWRCLVTQMDNAFTGVTKSGHIRQDIITVAQAHVQNRARELKDNTGPWVRAYCSGHDGSKYYWCVGYAITVLDQALSLYGLRFTDYVKNTLSCDSLALDAKKRHTLLRNKDLRKLSEGELAKIIEPGSLFLRHRSGNDWTHCGIVTEVDGTDIITSEGNTNDEGSRNGYETCPRSRDLTRQDIDIVLLKL